MTNNKTYKAGPIRFEKLRNGSKFLIIAEPSRGIRKSNDTTVYVKIADSHSLALDNQDKVAILMPHDIVRPLSRGDFN